ncbi:unnamed protein product [Enterobius vermicularis]|uniref:3-oxoacyl-[acyl-carrier-protein] reductase n=1 Tax=Enterobius vermicularis TaxID=51028 RepID=A0A0N4VM66_ENTVE|nr:unnamed protein product [Enterobius vermicularis]
MYRSFSFPASEVEDEEIRRQNNFILSSCLTRLLNVLGSSNGIGRATAIIFAREGAKVTITGRKPDALRVTKAECLKAGAKESDILDLIGDITTEEVQDRLINETIKKFDKLDILINNHGGDMKQQDDDGNILIGKYDSLIHLNSKSPFYMAVKSIPHLKKTKGCIVNVGSGASIMPTCPFPMYAMAKASLDHMTRLLAAKYAKDGIRVNSVNPGGTITAFMDNMGYAPEVQQKMRAAVSKSVIPFGRYAEADEIAKSIVFLADNDSSSYTTGQLLFVDGGMTLTAGNLDACEFATLRQQTSK